MAEINNRIMWLIDHCEGGIKARFAAKIGIPTGQLNNYVKDSPSVPKDALKQKICDAYGVTMAWLNGYEPVIGLKETPTAPPAPPPPATAPRDAVIAGTNMPVSAVIQLTTAKVEARMYKEWHEHDCNEHAKKMEEYFDKIDTNLNKVIALLSGMTVEKLSDATRPTADTQKPHQTEHRARNAGNHNQTQQHTAPP